MKEAQPLHVDTYIAGLIIGVESFDVIRGKKCTTVRLKTDLTTDFNFDSIYKIHHKKNGAIKLIDGQPEKTSDFTIVQHFGEQRGY